MGEQQDYRNTSMKNRHTNSVTHPTDTSPCRWCETVRFSNRVSSDNVFQFLKAQNYSFFCSSLFFWNGLWDIFTIIFTHTYLVFFYSFYSYLLRPLCHKFLMRVETHTRDRQTDRELLTSVFFFLEFWEPWEPLDDYSSCRCRRSVVHIYHRHDVSRTFVLVPTIVVVSRHVSVAKKLSRRLSVYAHSKGVEVPFILRAFYGRPQWKHSRHPVNPSWSSCVSHQLHPCSPLLLTLHSSFTWHSTLLLKVWEKRLCVWNAHTSKFPNTMTQRPKERNIQTTMFDDE